MRTKVLAFMSLVIVAVLWAMVGGVIAADVPKKGKGDDLHQILDALQRIESRLDALERAVKAMSGAPESKAASLPDPPAGKVTVKAAWEYRDFNGKIETYEALAGAKLWDTRTYKPGEKIALGAPVKDDLLFLEPGKSKLTVLVYRNPSPKEQTFYVIPHVADPSQYTADLDFKCACTGERYKVPANGAWARVIEFKLAPKVKPGGKIYTWMVAVGEH
jgi:hypothetical protein